MKSLPIIWERLVDSGRKIVRGALCDAKKRADVQGQQLSEVWLESLAEDRIVDRDRHSHRRPCLREN